MPLARLSRRLAASSAAARQTQWARLSGPEKELARLRALCDIEGMPNRLASALTFCLLAGLMTSLAAQEKPDAAYIRSMELKWTESYKQRQVDILASLLDEDFVITIEDGSTYGKTGYVSHSAEPSVHVEVAEMSDLRVRMHGNTAVVTGAYHEKGESNGKRYEYHDRFTDVWVKNGSGKWQVVASHYSVPMK
jgi:ketosteroid isomerase-like protein